ncbi:hypothetical protein RISK_004416 [Rhodopirellula islandica]|uniref:Uncharacterized protein n=1 Tax=Rhodopirellula islandica TaxID=595434 RepID=A0A0J1EDB4_RHOIS|nr:hypothetical protein RISK_004416 [Rhodopirellula islandica]
MEFDLYRQSFAGLSQAVTFQLPQAKHRNASDRGATGGGSIVPQKP